MTTREDAMTEEDNGVRGVKTRDSATRDQRATPRQHNTTTKEETARREGRTMTTQKKYKTVKKENAVSNQHHGGEGREE